MKRFILYIFLSLFLFSCDESTSPNPKWWDMNGTWRVTGEEPHLQTFKSTDTSFYKYGVWYIGKWSNMAFTGEDYSEQPNIHILSRKITLYLVTSDSLYGAVIIKRENENYATRYDTLKFSAKKEIDF